MILELTQIALVLTATSLTPLTPTVYDQVDGVELNHVYDSDGRLVLQQLIFWDWHDRPPRSHVVAWRLWKPGQPMPLRDQYTGGYRLLFHDGQTLRLVRARVYRETWTQFDPEIDDRQQLSQERRRGLIAAESPTVVR